MEHFVKYRNWYYLGTSILFVLIAASTSPLYEFNRNPDGQVYMDIGKMLFYGKSPYSELFDHKGPLIFLLYGVGYAINPGNFFGVALIEIGTIYFSLVSVVLAISPANLLPNIHVGNNAIFRQDYST